ncbi:hypothetical protein CDAR_195681 [Caerostris darwini]|uniref:Uncharacterized protein n=1 Tax=Caerostris darwini TaxID=1538125 RepID=A0AAV4S7F3_9ARAC|nr:hypothetical protein CDAR_195681 [Caerostris darwini]
MTQQSDSTKRFLLEDLNGGPKEGGGGSIFGNRFRDLIHPSHSNHFRLGSARSSPPPAGKGGRRRGGAEKEEEPFEGCRRIVGEAMRSHARDLHP